MRGRSRKIAAFFYAKSLDCDAPKANSDSWVLGCAHATGTSDVISKPEIDADLPLPGRRIGTL